MARTKSRTKYWIQEAIQKPGALRAWAKRNANKIKKLTGESPFTRDNKLKVSVLRKLKELHKKGKIKLDTTTIRRINLALTLRKLRG